MIESVGGSMKDATGIPVKDATEIPVGVVVVDSTAWWPLVRQKLTACWPQLLAVYVLFALVDWASMLLRGALAVLGQYVLGTVLALAVGHLAAAWQWSAALRILDGGHGFAAALRPDLGRIGRVAGWMVLLDVLALSQLLIFVDSAAYVALFSSGGRAFLWCSLYLTYATALLPMAVLLDGQGVRRAWRLTHGRWSTVLMVLPVLAVQLLIRSQLALMTGLAMGDRTNPLGVLAAQAVSSLVMVAVGVPVAVLLYAAYRLAAVEIARTARCEAALTDAQ